MGNILLLCDTGKFQYCFCKENRKHHKDNGAYEGVSIAGEAVASHVISCHVKKSGGKSERNQDLAIHKIHHQRDHICGQVDGFGGSGSVFQRQMTYTCEKKQQKGSCTGTIQSVVSTYKERNQCA